jgi:hypothetical protein
MQPVPSESNKISPQKEKLASVGSALHTNPTGTVPRLRRDDADP